MVKTKISQLLSIEPFYTVEVNKKKFTEKNLWVNMKKLINHQLTIKHLAVILALLEIAKEIIEIIINN